MNTIKLRRGLTLLRLFSVVLLFLTGAISTANAQTSGNAFTLSPIVKLDTIGTPNPQFEENPHIPTISMEHIKSGLAARVIAEQMKRDGFVPFGAETTETYRNAKINILKWDETSSAFGFYYEKAGEPYVEFKRNKHGLVTGIGRIEGVRGGFVCFANWARGIIGYSNAAMKFAPYRLIVEGVGQVEVILIYDPSHKPNRPNYIITFGLPENPLDYPQQPYVDRGTAIPSILLIDPNDPLIAKWPLVAKWRGKSDLKMAIAAGIIIHLQREGRPGAQISVDEISLPKEFERRIFPVVIGRAE